MTGLPEADALARAVAQRMQDSDRVLHQTGMVVEEVRLGYARLSMIVREPMLNGHDICHGGLIFTLADTAMAYAANGRNQTALAQMAEIDFVRPAERGDRLTVICEERHRGARSGIYDAAVRCPKGRLIALFRGRVRTVNAKVLDRPAAG